MVAEKKLARVALWSRPSVGDRRAAHFLLYSKRHIGCGILVRAKGLTGHYKPERQKGDGDSRYETFPPEDGKKFWIIGSGIGVFLFLELVLHYVAAGTRLGVDAQQWVLILRSVTRKCPRTANIVEET